MKLTLVSFLIVDSVFSVPMDSTQVNFGTRVIHEEPLPFYRFTVYLYLYLSKR